MKKNLPFKWILMLATIFAGGSQMKSQVTSCPYNGLNPNYCSNAAAVTLTPSVPGGTFTGTGISGSVFTPSNATIGTNTITYNTCSSSYSVVAGTYSPVPSATAGAVAVAGDDVISGALPIGFSFVFFCSTYTQFYAGSNGFITFNNASLSGCCQGLAMPSGSGSNPNNMIAGCWTDLNTGLAPVGNITYTTTGTAPNRRLIVSYNGVAHHNGGSGGFPITSQIMIYETSNIIEVHTGSVTVATTYSQTLGIQNAAGTVGYAAPGRNGTQWSATNDMYQFVPGPSCNGTQTTVVSAASIGVTGNNGPLCSGSTITLTANSNSTYTWTTPSGTFTTSTISVNPTTNTSYSVAGTNSNNCTSNVAITTVTVNNTPTVTAVASPATPSICLGNTVILNGAGANTYTFTNAGVVNNTAFSPTSTANYTVVGTNACGTSTGNISVTVTPLPLTPTASSTLVCAGTSATLTANGATNYTWSPGASNLGSYIVNPTANTVYTLSGKTGVCIGSATLAVNIKPNPTLSVSANHTAICNGDQVTLNVTGNAVTYTWTPGGIPGASYTDAPGNTTLYSVTGTNSVNCVSTAQQVIIVNPLPVVNAVASNPLVCALGSSTLSASGASTYVWTGGSNATTSVMVVNPATDQTYTVTGTSSLSCSSTTVVSVGVYSPTISISSPTAICLGGTTLLNAGVADTYSWSNNQFNQNTTVSPSLTTVFTLTASVNNLNGLSCIATNSVQVTVNPNPTVSATANRTTICVGESTTLTAAGADSYTFTGGSAAVTSSVSVVNPIANQTYTVTGIDANGCKGKGTFNLVVSQCTGISVNSINTANLSVYPNPNNGEFTISSDEAITLQITNELGQHVKTVVLDKNTTDVKLNNLPNGIYFITGKNANGSVKQKIVITK